MSRPGPKPRPREERLADKIDVKCTAAQRDAIERAAAACRLPVREYMRRCCLPRRLWPARYLQGRMSEALGVVLRDARQDPQPGDLFERVDRSHPGPGHYVVTDVLYRPRFRVTIRLCVPGSTIIVLRGTEWDGYVSGYRCAWLAPDTSLRGHPP